MLFGRRLLTLSLGAAVSTSRGAMTTSVPTCRIIDSAIHLWSDGAEPYPWAAAPPPDLQKAATAEAYIARAREAGVAGALVVQPANHMYDHSFVTRALKEHPTFFRGMGLANPTAPVAEAVAELEALHAAGFVGVRFNAGNFQGGLTSDVGRALYKRAGELGMPVGVMAFKGLAPFAAELQSLCQEYPATTLLVDHLGFFRQPAIGGQLGDAATNEEASWAAVLSLAKHPQVYVKVREAREHHTGAAHGLRAPTPTPGCHFSGCRSPRYSAPRARPHRLRTSCRGWASCWKHSAPRGSCGAQTSRLCCREDSH